MISPVVFESFFQELGNLSQRGRRTDATAAGLLTMRAVDAWLRGDAADNWGVAAISRVVDALEENAVVRGRLQKLVDDVQRTRNASAINRVLQSAFDYALQLEQDSAYALAAEVFGFIAYNPFTNARLRAISFLRQAYSFRRLGVFKASLGATRHARLIARRTGDRASYLRSFIGDAQTSLHRGHFSHARRLLRHVSVRARRWGLPSVLAKALHDRAWIAGLENQHERCARLAHAALQLTPRRADRQRIVLDLAIACLRLGMRSIARDVFLELSRSAIDQSMKWNSLMNLVELESANGNIDEMRRHERAFDGTKLPPNLLATYLVTVGQAYTRVGMREAARGHLLRALAVATEHGFDNHIAEANTALTGQVWMPPTEPQSPLSDLFSKCLVAEIRAMRKRTRDEVASGSEQDCNKV